MTTTITATNGAGSTTPVAVDGYEADREPQNIIHRLISGGIAVSLIAPLPRSGILELVYADDADAHAALNLHAEETTFELINDARTGLDMTYVSDNRLSIRLDQTRAAWVVSVGFQEVET